MNKSDICSYQESYKKDQKRVVSWRIVVGSGGCGCYCCGCGLLLLWLLVLFLFFFLVFLSLFCVNL